MHRKVKELPPEAYKFFLQNPVKFVEKMILRLSNEEIKEDKINRRLEPATKEILYNIGTNDYVSIFGGRGITKSFSLAAAAIWWVWTRSDARVIATGPKFDQLKITLWAEIQKLLNMSIVGDEIKWSSERIYHINPKMQSFGQIITSKDKENIAGIHATHVLWLIDEASNVDQELVNAILGGMNDPENKCIMAGNPTKASGPFFDTHNKDREQWKCLRFSSEDSARKNAVWFKRMQRHPRESDMYRVYVLGLPPLGNPKSVISLSDCQSARDRTVEAGNYLEIGLDPAREGNDLTAIAIRQGMKLLEIRVFAKTKAPEVCMQTLKMLREYRKKTGISSKVRVKVDETGYGGGITDYLALNETDNIEVVPVLFGGKGNDEYADYATIMWFNMADVIAEAELPDDEELIEELSTREWNPASANRMQVESKGKYKERLGRSPDRADACIMCYDKGPKMVFQRGEDVEPVSKDFKIDWQNTNIINPSFDGILMIEVLHYAALVLNSDLSFMGLSAIYQNYLDKLWIYEEFYQERPEPDSIAKVISIKTKRGLYDDDRNVRIIGNERMFRQDGDRRPLADVFRQENLPISEPVRYDEYGAIALGARMFNDGKVIIHSDAKRARSQINLWSIKSGKPDVDNSGFCKAFLLILSEVRRQKKELPKEHKMPDYHSVKKEEPKRRTSWCSR